MLRFKLLYGSEGGATPGLKVQFLATRNAVDRKRFQSQRGWLLSRIYCLVIMVRYQRHHGHAYRAD